MHTQTFDDRLLKLLEKETLAEKWKNKIRISGEVIKKKLSKKGSIVFIVKTSKSEYGIVVSKHRKKEFEFAKSINEGDMIKAIGDRQASGIIFCDMIKVVYKINTDENQMKLV